VSAKQVAAGAGILGVIAGAFAALFGGKKK